MSGAKKQGYQTAVQQLRARLPDADEKELWDGLLSFIDIGIRENGKVYFVADDEAEVGDILEKARVASAEKMATRRRVEIPSNDEEDE
ncbi:hypothetical protein Dimus_008459 [Dionaea muscipula]